MGATTNLILNPSWETNTNGWTANNLTTYSRVSGGLFGSYCGYIYDVASGAAESLATTSSMAVVAGTWYAFSVYLKKNTDGTTDTGTMGVSWYTAGDVAVSSNSTTLTAGTFTEWTRFTLLAQAPVGAAKAYLYFDDSGVTAGHGWELFIDGVQFEAQTAATPYCDGDQYGCTWSGTAHASTSSRASTVEFDTLYLSDGVTTYNLYTGPLKLRYQGWEMQSPMPEGNTKLQGYGASFEFQGYNTITETYQLYATGLNNDAVIRRAKADIDRLLEQARRWHKDHDSNANPVWLVFGTETEAARHSLVYGGACTMLAQAGAQPSLSNNVAAAILTIVRHPLWEDIASSSIDATASPFTYGGLSTVAAVRGTAPARFMITVMPAAGGDITPLTKLWVGILASGHVSRANFNPCLPLTSGTINVDPVDFADPVADADGIGANVIQTKWATTAAAHKDLHPIVSISLSQIDAAQAHWPDFRGTYRVLCRCKVSAANTTVGLQLRSGSSLDTVGQQNTEVVVTSTAYHWVDLGETTIPVQSTVSLLFWGHGIDHKLIVAAEQIAGAGELSVDYLVLMPSEHMVYVENAYVGRVGGVAYYATIGNNEADAPISYTADGTHLIVGTPMAATKDFYFPVYSGGVAVLVAERTAAHVETDQVLVSFEAYPRWLSYRDA